MSLRRAGNVVPIVDTFVEDTETPVSAFLKLRGNGTVPASCSNRPSRAAASVATRSSDSTRTSSSAGPTASCWSGRGTPLPTTPPNRRAAAPAPDPYGAVAERIGSFGLADAEGLPFAGGAVGLFGYDLVRTVEPLGPPNPDPLGLPDLALMVPSLIVAFDHHRHEVSIIALAFAADGEIDDAYERAVEQIGAARERLRTAPSPVARRTPRRRRTRSSSSRT